MDPVRVGFDTTVDQTCNSDLLGKFLTKLEKVEEVLKTINPLISRYCSNERISHIVGYYGIINCKKRRSREESDECTFSAPQNEYVAYLQDQSFTWPVGYRHTIMEHGVMPPVEFVDFIMKLDTELLYVDEKTERSMLSRLADFNYYNLTSSGAILQFS